MVLLVLISYGYTFYSLYKNGFTRIYFIGNLFGSVIFEFFLVISSILLVLKVIYLLVIFFNYYQLYKFIESEEI